MSIELLKQARDFACATRQVMYILRSETWPWGSTRKNYDECINSANDFIKRLSEAINKEDRP